MEMENWVLCRIFLKKRGTKNEEEDITKSSNGNKGRSGGNSKAVRFYDFMAKEKKTDLNEAPACSSSSGITEVSSTQSDEHEEEISNCNNLSTFRRKALP